mgnify:CR=1 FL=1
MVIPFLFLSCDQRQIEEHPENLLKFEYFEEIASLHNEFLTNVKNNLILENNIDCKEAKIDFITAFQNDFLKTCHMSYSEKELISKDMEQFKNLVDIENTMRLVGVAHGETKNEDTVSVFTLIETAEVENILDTFELRMLTKISELAKMGFEGTITDYQFMRALQKMKNDWIAMGYLVEENCGYVSGCAIAISIASMEWWELNPDAGMLETKGSYVLIPAWAVADAVGAIWGATSGAIGSYVINGEVRWGSVGFGALSGAVAGSTGVVGKVAKWISKTIN